MESKRNCARPAESIFDRGAGQFADAFISMRRLVVVLHGLKIAAAPAVFVSDMSTTWNTKYGSRRVRHDPPTLNEAIAAAQGLTDQLSEQVEIAAALIGVPPETVRAEILKQTPRNAARIAAPAGREIGSRTVIVERKSARRIVRPNGA